MMLMPFMFLAIIPTIAAVLPGMRSDSFLMVIPIANIVVAIKELLEGSPKILSLIGSNVINLVYAGVMLRFAVSALQREGALVPGATGEKGLSGRDPLRTGIATFVISWLILYYFLTTLQVKSLAAGLLIEFWIVFPLIAYLHLRYLKLPFKKTIQWRMPSIRALISVPFITLGGFIAVNVISVQVMKYLPMPKSFMEGMEEAFFSNDFSTGFSIFILCVSPGIIEELLFRGALMGGFLRRISPWKAVVLTGLMFGFFHFSVYRFLPTTILGIIFGFLVVYTGSLIPGILAHFLNNFLALHILPYLEEQYPDLPWESDIPWFITVLGFGFLIIGILIVRSDWKRRSGIQEE